MFIHYYTTFPKIQNIPELPEIGLLLSNISSEAHNTNFSQVKMLCLGDDARILTTLIETLHIKLSGCKSFPLPPYFISAFLIHKNTGFPSYLIAPVIFFIMRKYCSLISP